jgi:hypothetical protein
MNIKHELKKLGYGIERKNVRNRSDFCKLMHPKAKWETFPISGSGPHNYFYTRDQLIEYIDRVKRNRAWWAANWKEFKDYANAPTD